MKILVTGAGGFVGQHLLQALETEFPDAEVIAGDPDQPGGKFDITDSASVDALVKLVQPNSCVHLAAVAAIGDARSNPLLAWKVNLDGTLALASAILRHAPACRLVFASSADLYGSSFRSGLPLDETALPAPLNVYGATKAAADLALGAMAAEGLQVVRVRPFNHTGPGQSASFVVAAFARQMMRIKAGLQPPVMKVGDLSPFRDFLDVRDVCAAYALCLRPDIAISPGTILNIASGRPIQVGALLDALLTAAGVTASVETERHLLRKSDIPFAAGNAAAALALLGWKPLVPLTTTLDDVIADWATRVATESVPT